MRDGEDGHGGVRPFNVDADVLFLEERGCQVATGGVQINSKFPLKFKTIDRNFQILKFSYFYYNIDRWTQSNFHLEGESE